MDLGMTRAILEAKKELLKQKVKDYQRGKLMIDRFSYDDLLKKLMRIEKLIKA